MTIEKDQSKFFDNFIKKTDFDGKENFNNFEKLFLNRLYDRLIDKLNAENEILDYGCGTGKLIYSIKNYKDKKISGIDISEESLNLAKKNFPQFKFYNVEQVDDIKNIPEVGCVSIVNLLHHTNEHEKIICFVQSILKKNGSLIINDLTSHNPFVSFARKVFIYMPKIIKNKFSKELFYENTIPEKINLNLNNLIKIIQKNNLEIIEIEYDHLFVFLFGYLNNVINLDNNKVYLKFVSFLRKFELLLINKTFFKNFCEVVHIHAKKK